MAIPWLTAIKAIPWRNVIDHAPNVLEKARYLIDKQRKPFPAADEENLQEKPADSSDQTELEKRFSTVQNQIKLLQQKSDLLEIKLIDQEKHKVSLSKDIKYLRRSNRWLLFLCSLLIFGNIALWILRWYSQQFV